MTSEHTIRPGSGDDVWRDEAGTVWVRQRQMVDAVKFNVERVAEVLDKYDNGDGECEPEDRWRLFRDLRALTQNGARP